MLLYHGSNIEIKNIDLSKCRPYKDFGRGFYLTSLKEQAETWAIRTSRIFSGDPWITIFEFDAVESLNALNALNAKIFDAPNGEWATFVLNNRNRNFSDYESPNANHDNKYDVVIGAVANDDIALQMRLFTSGIIDIETLVKAMKYRKLNDQYSFHTEKSLSHLTKVGVYCCIQSTR